MSQFAKIPWPGEIFPLDFSLTRGNFNKLKVVN